MADIIFTRKKVTSLTLGERLRKCRRDFHMSLAEVSRATKIQVKYLEAIEQGDYAHLPADVYTRGFLRSYAHHLGVDGGAILKLYENEKHIAAHLGRDQPVALTPARKEHYTFVITARSFWTVFVSLLLVGVALYLGQEFRNFAGIPRLFIYEPADQSVTDTGEVIVRGATEKGARVLINDEPALVDAQGEFVERLVLQPGINIIRIRALNRFGKEREEQLTLEARHGTLAESTLSIPGLPEEQLYSIIVRAEAYPVYISVTADGTTVFSGRLEAGTEQEITARSEISVTSERGDATIVRYPGGPGSPLAETATPVEQRVFAPPSKE